MHLVIYPAWPYDSLAASTMSTTSLTTIRKSVVLMKLHYAADFYQYRVSQKPNTDDTLLQALALAYISCYFCGQQMTPKVSLKINVSKSVM